MTAFVFGVIGRYSRAGHRICSQKKMKTKFFKLIFSRQCVDNIFFISNEKSLTIKTKFTLLSHFGAYLHSAGDGVLNCERSIILNRVFKLILLSQFKTPSPA